MGTLLEVRRPLTFATLTPIALVGYRKAHTVPLNASARQALAEYLAPRLNCDPMVKEDDYFHKDDRLVRLAHIAPKKGATFLYEYDFGDCWKHEISSRTAGIFHGLKNPNSSCKR